MNKRVFILVLLGIFLIGIVSSAESEYCCEKTTDGAWCIETAQENCDSSINPVTGSTFRKAPTSCSSTSYCRLGTCINGKEGICLPNVPQIRCQEEGGYWDERDKEDVPQCKLGCCLMGDGASFITQTACKRLSELYGFETVFKTNIQDQTQCILSAFPQEEGACVFEEDFEKTCRRTTRAECQEISTSSESTVEFHAGYLCSAEELATSCGPSKKTTCVKNKDEVYFLDTCGNLANIYDSSKQDDQEYWTYIKTKDESCNSNSANKNSRSCGNCNYLLGSTCSASSIGNNPTYGEYICGSLDCEYDGETHLHGESWCLTTVEKESYDFLPGSEHYRLICYNGEVTIENPEPWRAQICVEDEIEGYKTASFRTNNWQDCTSQDNKEDCENTEKRDCKWVTGPEGFSVLRDSEGNSLTKNSKGEVGASASCVPLYSPAFDFWDSETQAVEECGRASTTCVVKYSRGLFEGSWDCEENCQCDPGNLEKLRSWMKNMDEICVSLGDCGSSVNYIGEEGYQSESAVTVSGRKKS